MDDGITNVQPVCEILIEKHLKEILLRAVCNEHFDGLRNHLLCVVSNKNVVDIASHFRTKEHFK